MGSLRPTTPLAVTVTLAVMLTALLSPATSAPAASLPPYTNHTVGGTTGWFFNVKKNSSADYSKWAQSQSFYLGDFLIFKTNSNMSVMQTTNETTYNRCDASEDDGTLIYTIPGVDNEKFGVSASIAVPLTAEGANYFFSGADDGIQCAKGMRFEIEVEKGRGLPPALSQPPPPPASDVQVPPPPDTEIDVKGGGPQGEAFYTGGGERRSGGARGWEIWVLGVLGAVFLVGVQNCASL